MNESSIEEYQIAPISKRLGAFFIDETIVALLVMVIYYSQLTPLLKSFQNTQDIVPVIEFFNSVMLSLITLKVIYQTFFVWQNGMTPGKMMMKVAVIDMRTGRTPTFEVAFLRASFRILSEIIMNLGYFFAYFNPMVQTLHDKVAKTIVVNA
ncbi:MAG: RDD family protein [Campylobacterales bacterium]|nr:RDD family protein [Campylobacterales bacterium]